MVTCVQIGDGVGAGTNWECQSYYSKEEDKIFDHV